MNNLCNIDTRNSEAGDKDDEKKIKVAVKDTNGGFQAVNQNCQMGIQSGLVEIGKRYLKEMERKEEEGEEGDEEDGGGIDLKKQLLLMNQLAMLLHDQGNYKEAEPLHKRALAGFEELLGSNHSSTLSSVNNLADLLKKQGKLEEAIPLFERELRGMKEIHGIKHSDTIYSAKNLVEILKQQGRADEAHILIQEYEL